MSASTDPRLVGLDIGTTGVRAVQVTRQRRTGEYSIARAASVELPRGAVRGGVVRDEQAVVKALRALWRAGRFSTRKVVFGISDNSVLTRQVDLPWMPPADFSTALKYQVGDALPVDLATVELDYHLLGEAERMDERGQVIELNRILVVAASTDSVVAQAGVVRRARLEPVVADSAAFALIRAACQGRLPAQEEARAIADLGAEQLTVVVHRAGQPLFIRTIGNLGGDNATGAIAERLDVDPDEAERLKRTSGMSGPSAAFAPIAESSVFGDVGPGPVPALEPRVGIAVDILNAWATTIIGEIRNSIDYFQASNPSTPVASLSITGRAAELEGLLDRISTQIPLAVGRMDPLAGLAASRRVSRHHAPDTRLIVAAGLAMGAQR